MKKINRLWGALFLVVFVTGCPDGPPQILRDERNAAAEVADYLSKVVDEESAANAKAVLDRLKDRWESIKKRRENFLKLADKSEKKEFSILQKQPDYDSEMKATIARLKREGMRVRGIIFAFSDEKVVSEVSQFESKVFGGQLKIPDDPMPPEQKKLF
jgi:hypothetical protein